MLWYTHDSLDDLVSCKVADGIRACLRVKNVKKGRRSFNVYNVVFMHQVGMYWVETEVKPWERAAAKKAKSILMRHALVDAFKGA